MRITTVTVPRSGSGYYVRWFEVFHKAEPEHWQYFPTLQGARLHARGLLRRGVLGATILQPLEHLKPAQNDR